MNWLVGGQLYFIKTLFFLPHFFFTNVGLTSSESSKLYRISLEDRLKGTFYFPRQLCSCKGHLNTAAKPSSFIFPFLYDQVLHLDHSHLPKKTKQKVVIKWEDSVFSPQRTSFLQTLLLSSRTCFKRCTCWYAKKGMAVFLMQTLEIHISWIQVLVQKLELSSLICFLCHCTLFSDFLKWPADDLNRQRQNRRRTLSIWHVLLMNKINVINKICSALKSGWIVPKSTPVGICGRSLLHSYSLIHSFSFFGER